MRRLGLFLIGVVLSIALIEAGAVVTGPTPPACPHCAVLSQPYGCHNAEAVTGGYICEP